MKIYKFFAFFIVLFYQSNLSYGCDVCGCGVGSYYFGIMPQFQKNFIGLRHRYSSFDSHLGYKEMFRTKEFFYTTEIWARYYVNKKIQIMAFLPYTYNIQKTQTQTNYLQGLTDISMLASYPLWATPNDSLGRKFKHSLRVGAGVKLPTGKYHYEENTNSEVANPNFQLGTGSYDFLFNLSYVVRHQKLGISADITYKWNTQNTQNYKFGNRLSGNIALFYLQKITNQWAIMPNIGIYFENSGLDKRNQQVINETGGYFWANTIGIETYIAKKISLGTNYQIPILQDLAFGQINANSRIVAQLSFLF